MATVKDLAAYVCDKLAGKVLIHRYDAYSTNSVYLKFDYGLGNSLRLSDHTGKAGLNYRFNIITTMKSLGIDTSGEYPRFYYPPDMVDQAIADIRKVEKEEKACATCGNLVRIGGTLIGCVAHDKLILPNYPPYFGQKPCPDWKP